MSPDPLSHALAQALDAPGSETGPRTVQVQAPEGRATVQVEAVGPIGARVRSIQVEVDEAGTPQEQADAFSGRLPGLEEALVPVEVDAVLGGGLLRSDPQDMRGDGFFELELRGGRARLDRRSTTRDGQRQRQAREFVLTRDQLGRLVDELAQGLAPSPDDKR